MVWVNPGGMSGVDSCAVAAKLTNNTEAAIRAFIGVQDCIRRAQPKPSAHGGLRRLFPTGVCQFSPTCTGDAFLSELRLIEVTLR